MAFLFEKSVISPVYIGRAEYLTSLEHIFQQLVSEKRRVVLISGEAGIGKSRLVTEAQTRLGSEPVRFLRGTCFEQSRTILLAPFVDAFRTLFGGEAASAKA